MIPKAFAPGMVTSDGWEYGGVFTPDLKEFYFIREVIDDEGNPAQQVVLIQNHDGDVDIFWVDAQVIETLRPKEKE